MTILHKLLVAVVLATSALAFAPNADAQNITIAIGDRPYYNRGPSYWDGGYEYYWVQGHRGRHGRWTRGHYVRRSTPLRKLHREHIKLHHAIFGR